MHVDYYQLVDAPEAVMPDVFDGDRPRVDRPRSTSASARGARRTRRASAARTSTDLDDYGLDRETVAEAFADYTERFDIPSEDARDR